MSTSTACTDSPCRSYRAGHRMHHIHARHLAQEPWGWRDATVVAVDDHSVTLAYVGEGTTLTIWHHHGLGDVLTGALPVRVHEGMHALGHPGGWLSVAIIEGGLGAVAEPTDVGLWAADVTPGVVDLATGDGVATDHADR